MHVENYILIITIIGLAAMAMTWLPDLLRKSAFSYPIIFVAGGFLLYLLPLELPDPEPLRYKSYVVRLTELGVIITLMGTGLKLEREFTWRHWNIPLKLVSLTMVLCIAGLGFMAWGFLGMVPASAILLGAVLAPTDPVLANDVQVGPPKEGKADHVRFSLTAEAGMNDGMAFPFTWLAVQMALAVANETGYLGEWLVKDVLYRIVAGVAIGYGFGRFLAYVVFKLPKKTSFPKAKDGFLAVSATLLIYGLTEMLQGYGFIAVFVAAVTFSSFERHSEYHREMHDFTDQIERILVVILLIAFGGSLANGILEHLTWQGALTGLVFVLIIRPLAAWLGLIGVKIPNKEKAAISFFGIRGIGSFFYLAFAIDKIRFAQAETLWSITAFVVLVSIFLHGTLAKPVVKYLDKVRQQEGRSDTALETNN